MKSPTRSTKTPSSKAKTATKTTAGTTAFPEASTQVLALPKGLYLFSVRKSPQLSPSKAGDAVPTIEIGPGPGVETDQFQILSSPNMAEAKLIAQGDVIVGKVSKEGAAVLLTSIRPPEATPLEIQIQRLDTQTIERSPAAEPPKTVAQTGITGSSGSKRAKSSIAKGPAVAGDVPLQVVAHIQNRGDVPFTDTLWAGFLGSRLSMEALSIAASGAFDGGAIEYKTLDATGGETPWATDAALCGSRGRGLPLTGFCVRVKPQGGGALYDCEYSGAFTSGKVVGPVKNGAPCRSTTPGDFLEAVQIKMVKRQPAKA